MVDQTSASLNLDRETCLLIGGDHRTMARLKTGRAGVFHSLVGHIQDCLQSGTGASVPANAPPTKERQSPSQEVHNINETNGQSAITVGNTAKSNFESNNVKRLWCRTCNKCIQLVKSCIDCKECN